MATTNYNIRSGQHLSSQLKELIREIGETRSKQEEDKIIQIEATFLKENCNQIQMTEKQQKENIIRAIYIEMLGHNANFMYIHAINLAQNSSLHLKKIGYLASSLFLNEQNELLILLISSIQKDLQSNNILEISAAINALSKLLYKSIASILFETILQLFHHQHIVIRKKSLILLYRIHKYCFEVPNFYQILRKALCDNDPGVMGVSLTIFLEEIKLNTQKYKDLIQSFVNILKQIIDHKLSKDFDFHYLPAPWLQIKILQILAILAENDQQLSEICYAPLKLTLQRADDTGLNIGYAITYQCIQCITTIYPNQELIQQATKSITKFLQSENNNLKYIGISSLTKIIKLSPQFALDHQLTVVDCLESSDNTLKRQTLSLLSKMVNSDNIQIIIGKLMNYLQSTVELHIKKEMVYQINYLSENFAPKYINYIIQIIIFQQLKLLMLGGEFAGKEIINSIIKIINDNFQNDNLNGSYIFEIYNKEEYFQQEIIKDQQAKIIAWVFGEIGSDYYKSNFSKLDELANKLIIMLNRKYKKELTKTWILNALAKISSVQGYQNQELIKQAFIDNINSENIEISQRCKEFLVLAKYRGFLRQVHLLEVDKNLSFLNSFVQKAIEMGSKDKKISIQNLQINQQKKEEEYELKVPLFLNNNLLQYSGKNMINKNQKIFKLMIKVMRRMSQISVLQINKQYNLKGFNSNIKIVWNSQGFRNQEQKTNHNSQLQEKMDQRLSIENIPSAKEQRQNQKVEHEIEFKNQQQTKIDQRKKELANDLFGSIQYQQPLPFQLNKHDQVNFLNKIEKNDISFEQFKQDWQNYKEVINQKFENIHNINSLDELKNIIENQIKLKILEIIDQDIIASGIYNSKDTILSYFSMDQKEKMIEVQIKSSNPQILNEMINHIKLTFYI